MESVLRRFAVVSDEGTTLGIYETDTNWAALRAYLAEHGDKRAKSKRLAVTMVNGNLWLDGITVRETTEKPAIQNGPFGANWEVA